MARITRSDLSGLFRTIDPKSGRMMLSGRDAAFLGRMIDEVERIGKLSATAPLLANSGPDGRSLVLGGSVPTTGALPSGDSPGDTGFVAKLRGSSGTGASPYGFDEQVWNGSAFIALTGGRSSSTGAIEAAGKSSLGGKLVYLYPLDSSNFYFQWFRSPSCAPCSLPWGSDLHISYVVYDGYCNPTTLFSQALPYVAGGLFHAGGTPAINVDMGLPNTPGYWDTGAFSIPTFNCLTGPFPGTLTNYTAARFLLFCAVDTYWNATSSTNDLGYWLIVSETLADAAGWPGNNAAGEQIGTCVGNTIGTPITSSGFTSTLLNLRPGFTCKPLFLQGDFGGNPSCPTTLTISQ